MTSTRGWKGHFESPGSQSFVRFQGGKKQKPIDRLAAWTGCLNHPNFYYKVYLFLTEKSEKPWKTNTETQSHGGLEDNFPFQLGDFWGSMLIFQSVLHSFTLSHLYFRRRTSHTKWAPSPVIGKFYSSIYKENLQLPIDFWAIDRGCSNSVYNESVGAHLVSPLHPKKIIIFQLSSIDFPGASRYKFYMCQGVTGNPHI